MTAQDLSKRRKITHQSVHAIKMTKGMENLVIHEH